MKIGFEIHQQLDTKKLFCHSPSDLREEETEFEVRRRLRPSQSELGAVDEAAAKEFLKGKAFVYKGHNDSICLVELDEEPPRGPNEEAVEIALTLALLCNAHVVDEIHFMRKMVIDGSNTSGFQRTAVIAFNGYLDTEEGRIRIPTICLEEEAARKVAEDELTTTYNLDRLGIPLVEITTDPDIKSPRQAREVALKIGEILRATGRVKRGIGTIRQDINVSIEGGARVEIKGVQELNTIPKIVENEVERQKGLIRIKMELGKRSVSNASIGGSRVEDVTDIFKKTDSLIIKSQMENGLVLGIKLQGFNGLLGGGLLGREIARYVNVHSGMKGIFHSDELPAYGINEDEVSKVRKRLNAGPGDAFVIIAGDKEICNKASEIVLMRADFAVSAGVLYETRMAVGDKTEYMRPLPGAARMYPETDILPYAVSNERIERLKKSLPKTYEEKEDIVSKRYGLGTELSRQLVRSQAVFSVIEELASKLKGLTVTGAASIGLDWRRDVEAGQIKPQDLSAFLIAVDEGRVAKEASPDVREKVKSGIEIEEAISQIAGAALNIEEIIDKIVLEKAGFIKEKGISAEKPLMGLVMKEARGKVDGKAVSEVLRKKLDEFLSK